jgi:hypothetical protein
MLTNCVGSECEEMSSKTFTINSTNAFYQESLENRRCHFAETR